MILEALIIGLLFLNIAITVVSEKKRRDLSVNLAKQGNDSINSFIKIFNSLDGKLKTALEVIDESEKNSGIVLSFGEEVGGAITGLSKEVSPETKIEQIKEKEIRIARNIESYITSLKYARDNFAKSAEEKQTVEALIKNISKHYGKNRTTNR